MAVSPEVMADVAIRARHARMKGDVLFITGARGMFRLPAKGVRGPHGEWPPSFWIADMPARPSIFDPCADVRDVSIRETECRKHIVRVDGSGYVLYAERPRVEAE